MKEDSQIDILLATYNGEKYLKEQIDSILNQTYKNFRLIISDDCSTDSTRDILKEYEENERIQVYYQEQNLGYIKNFEFLIKQVKNDIYMLSDQDDIWLPEKIEKTYNKLVKEDADLVFTDLEVVDENLNTIYESFNDYMLLSRKITKYIDSYKFNYLYNCITGCTIMAKKELINKVLPFPSNSKYMVHDYWLGIITAINGKVAYLNERTIKYRQHGNNQIGTNKISHKMKTLKEVRELFIEVKLQIFEIYVNNNQKFPEKIQILNNDAYNYFCMIRNKKNFNFKKWTVFHELYKSERFMYYIENFIIMNMPFIGRGLFKVRHGILKIMGKR